ncbi:MAG: hypothetical protein IH944_00690 [Armatimonadetes bacterium]|nr:hypothetical protein [Armatimonadota bacterium]
MIRCPFVRVILLGVLLLPTLSLAQERIVSFRAEAQTVPDLIAAINREFNTEYAADTALKSDIVCVQVTDVRLSDLLEKIAEVTASHWIQRARALTLEPSRVFRAEELKAEVSSKRESFERQLKSYERSWQRMGIDPGMKDLLPLDKIAAQPVWTVKVFAVSPTAAQKRLDSRLPGMLGTNWLQNRQRRNRNSQIEIGSYQDLHVVSRYNGNNVQITINATDANGAIIAGTSFTLIQTERFSRAATPDGGGEGVVIALDPVRREFAKLWTSLTQSPTSDVPQFVAKYLAIDPNLKAGVEQFIMSAATVEPLSVFVSPVLNEAARLEGRDLVALLPDRAMSLGNYVFGAATIRSLAALQSLDKSVLRTQRDGDWTILSPIQPSQARSDRMDRRRLGELVQNVRASGDLNPLELINNLPRKAMGSTELLPGYLGYFDMSVAGNAINAFSRQFSTFKALSTLPRSMLLTALAGSDVTETQLSGSAINSVRQDIFTRRLPVTRTTNIAWSNTLTIGSQGQIRSALPGQARVSPPIEVTDLLQHRFSELAVTIAPASKDMLQGRNEERRFIQRSTVGELAYANAIAEIGKSNARWDGILVCNEFMPVKQRYWTITYRFADGLTATTLVSWIEPDFKIGWRAFDALGQSYADQYEVAYRGSIAKIQRAQQAGAKRPVSRRRIPPPQN